MIFCKIHPVSYALALLAIVGCNNLQMNNKESMLTNNSNGKYWDIISTKNGLDRYNPTVKKSSKYKDATDGIPEECVFFGKDNKLLHYHNIDSIRIIDPHIFANDVFYNPDNYLVKGDTIEISSFKYKIVYLSEELLVVKRHYEEKIVLVIYAPSKWQDKVICKDFSCK